MVSRGALVLGGSWINGESTKGDAWLSSRPAHVEMFLKPKAHFPFTLLSCTGLLKAF